MVKNPVFNISVFTLLLENLICIIFVFFKGAPQKKDSDMMLQIYMYP
jgi:hypothetical protein